MTLQADYEAARAEGERVSRVMRLREETLSRRIYINIYIYMYIYIYIYIYIYTCVCVCVCRVNP